MCKQDHDIPGVYPKGMGMGLGVDVGMIGGMGMGVGTQSLVQLNVSTLYTVK